MNLELKKIHWVNFPHTCWTIGSHLKRNGMLCLEGTLYPLGQIFKIKNFIEKRNKLYFDPNVFYLYVDDKKIKNTFETLQQAKDAAQEECSKIIINIFFEPPIKRKVIIEKSKIKTIKKKKKVILEEPKAEVIDLRQKDKKTENISWNNINYDFAILDYMIKKKSTLFEKPPEDYPF
jgi:hypothetical protein